MNTQAKQTPWIAGFTGIVALGGAVAGAFATGWNAFFHAYLFSYMVCLGLALGGMCLLMLHNLTGGPWAEGIRPAARAASLTLPLLAALFVPLILGMPALYPWAESARTGAVDTLIVHRRPYLNPTFFVLRAVAYFLVWIALAILLRRWQRGFEREPSETRATRLRGLSAGGLILYLLTMTHAGIDWIMSRNTEFYSTAFGFILTVGQTLSALAFLLIVAMPGGLPKLAATREPRLRGVLNDVGNILLTLVILWAYVSFMEFLVIWMGNSHEDNDWFLKRGMAGDAGMNVWRWIGAALLLFHFFVPFYLLLFRKLKQNRAPLRGIAWVLLLAHMLEQYWLAGAPDSREERGFQGTWLDPLVLVGLLGVWLAAFAWMFRRAGPEAMPEMPEVEVAHD